MNRVPNVMVLTAVLGCVACGGAEPMEREAIAPGRELLATWSSNGLETDPSAELGARFGGQVATNGTWIMVIRQPVNGDSGRVEGWMRTAAGWTHGFTWKTSSDRHPVVALSSQWMVIGEPCNSPANGCTGQFVTFLLVTGSLGPGWTPQMQNIQSVNPWDYGSAVAVRGTTAAVAGSGKVDLFQLSVTSLNKVASFTEPATPFSGSGFGSQVALTNGGLAVSAPGGVRQPIATFAAIFGNRSPGFVYVFDLVTSAVTRLTGVGSEARLSGLGFGASLSAATDGNTLAVGAPVEVGRTATAYVFRRSSAGAWSLSNTIAPPAGASGSAISVAIDGFLGVTTNAPNSSTQGLLRFFEFVPPALGGVQQDASFVLDGFSAPLDLRAGTAIAGQPDFLGGAGYVATYSESGPVNAP